MTSSEESTSAESRGLPHREVADGFLVAKGDFRPTYDLQRFESKNRTFCRISKLLALWALMLVPVLVPAVLLRPASCSTAGNAPQSRITLRWIPSASAAMLARAHADCEAKVSTAADLGGKVFPSSTLAESIWPTSKGMADAFTISEVIAHTLVVEVLFGRSFVPSVVRSFFCLGFQEAIEGGTLKQ